MEDSDSRPYIRIYNLADYSSFRDVRSSYNANKQKIIKDRKRTSEQSLSKSHRKKTTEKGATKPHKWPNILVYVKRTEDHR